ncbi:MAG TPA: hypothetical protein VFE24_08490 [Pirellulales bacterium]|jgi:hypothetical protein|nr:hypothetical protein [Pirellulales bacterium]
MLFWFQIIRTAIGSRRRLLAGGWLAWLSIAGIFPLTVAVAQNAPQTSSQTQTIFSVSGPSGLGGAPNSSGLQLAFENGILTRRGFLPVRVAATVLKSHREERKLRLHITSQAFFFFAGIGSSKVDAELTIPAGTAQGQSVATTILVPQIFVPQGLEIRVFEGAQEWTAPSGPIFTNAWQSTNYAGGLVELIYSNGPKNPAANPPPTGPIVTTSETVGRDYLSPQWLIWSKADLVTTTRAELLDLFKTDPPAARALRRWVAAGGILQVNDFPRTWNPTELSELAETLKLNRPEIAARWEDLHDRSVDADPIETNQAPETNQATNAASETGPEQAAAPATRAEPDHTAAPEKTAADSQAIPAKQAELGLGIVVANNRPSAAWIGDIKLQTKARFDEDSDGTIHSDFMLGSKSAPLLAVGRAPFFAFLVLISLFVILIGPVNYRFLKRRQMVPLILLTVPAAALVFTLSFVAFAVLSEGFGTRVAVRTYTEIDQPRGEAVCWSRLAYYAGMAPSGGLVFDDNTVVYPIEASRNMRYSGDREMRWTGHQQHLTSGWLPSRVLKEYLLVRARPSTAKLEFTAGADHGLRVNNQLGTGIKGLLVIDSKGQPFEGGALAAEQTGDVRPCQQNAALSLDHLFAGNWAVLGTLDYSGLNSKWRWYWPINCGFEPRTYIAVVDRSPESQVGLDTYQEEPSVHIVYGRW